MASKIEISNMALLRLRAKPIISFSDNTLEAKTISSIYEMVARNVMSIGPWTSCVTRANLAQSITTPEFEFLYQYQLPTDPECIKVLKINECSLGDIKYAIEGDKLLCNEPSVQIQYIKYLEDSEQYDDYLRQAITERLIVEMSYSKTGDKAVLAGLETTFAAKVEGWLTNVTSQGSSQSFYTDTYIDARDEDLY